VLLGNWVGSNCLSSTYVLGAAEADRRPKHDFPKSNRSASARNYCGRDGVLLNMVGGRSGRSSIAGKALTMWLLLLRLARKVHAIRFATQSIALPVLVALVMAVPTGAQGQSYSRVKGVVDTSGMPLLEGSIRVLALPSHVTVARASIDANGRFEVDGLRPGRFVVVVLVRGFHSSRASVLLRDAKTIDLGTIKPVFLGCESGTLVCDSFAPEMIVHPVLGIPLAPPSTILRRGYIELTIDCGVDLQTGSSDCYGGQNVRADLRLKKEETGIFLYSLEGLNLYLPTAPKYDCGDATERESKIRVDGMGPSDDFCIQIGDHLVSHAFLIDYVEPDAKAVALRYVTQRRELDPVLENRGSILA
jgi:hypothetical protein